MKKLIALAMLALPAGAAFADGVAAGLTAGTLGAGAQIAFRLRDDLNLRAGVNGIDFSYGYDYRGVDYDNRVKLFNVPVIADWFPMKGTFLGMFRVSAGLAWNQNKIEATGRPRSGVYTIGNNTYSAPQIASVQGEAKYDSLAPYVGVGLGNPVLSGKRFGWNVDLGLMYQGRPKTSYNVVCGTGVNCAQLQADASIEAGDFDHDMSKYRLYPLAQVYLTWQF